MQANLFAVRVLFSWEALWFWERPWKSAVAITFCHPDHEGSWNEYRFLCADCLWRGYAFLQSCLSPVLGWGSSWTESVCQSSAYCLLSVQYYGCLGQVRWYFPEKCFVSFDHIRNSFVFAVLRKRVSGLGTLDFLWAVGPGVTHTRALGAKHNLWL